MDNTSKTIIIAGLVIPFIINAVIEAFMKNKTAKTVIQCLFTAPACSCYLALLGFWLGDDLPGPLGLILLFLVGLAVYVFAYHMAGWILMGLFGVDVEETPVTPKRTQSTVRKATPPAATSTTPKREKTASSTKTTNRPAAENEKYKIEVEPASEPTSSTNTTDKSAAGNEKYKI